MTAELLKRKYHGCEIVTTVTHTFAPDFHEVFHEGQSLGVFPMLARAVACAKEKNPPPPPADSFVEENDDTEIYGDQAEDIDD